VLAQHLRTPLPPHRHPIAVPFTADLPALPTH
jgi:hypothetical protein